MSAERLITQLEMITSTESSGSGIASISPLRNSTLVDAGLPLVLARQRQHLVGHVEPVGLAGRPDAPGRQQHVDAAARAEVEHRLARPGARPAPSGCRSRATPRRPPRREAPPVSVCRVEVRGDRVGARRATTPCRSRTRSPPATTRSAAWPYFSFTICLMSWSAMIGPPRPHDEQQRRAQRAFASGRSRLTALGVAGPRPRGRS